MTKLVLLVLAMLAQAPLVRAADLIDQFRTNRPVDEDKAVIDSMRPEEINAVVDENGQTALFYSRHLGTTLLLLAGANPNLPDQAGRTPAFRAVSRSHDVAFPIMLDLLLLAHADVNACDKEGISLLAWAVQEDNLPAAKLLLLLGANPAPADVRGDRTALSLALQGTDPEMANLLHGFVFGPPDALSNPARGYGADQALAVAARAAQLTEMSAALAAGAEINAQDKDGATALFRAVAARRAEVVAFLLLRGANPNLAKGDGKTPLMQCATAFDMASERMLMDLIVAGANINATARDGTTALSAAVHAQNDTAAQWMLWRGAGLDVHSPDGTLMEGAALHPGWPSMIAMLKKAGLPEAEPPAMLKDPVLHDLARVGTPEAIEAELKSGTPVDETNRYDQTALEWAIVYDRMEIVDLLLRHGANINHQHSYSGGSIMDTIAASQATTGTLPAVRLEKLIKRGANPNLVRNDGCTPLMVAAFEGAPNSTIEYLLTVTNDINARDKRGATALALAREHGHPDAARVLQDHGAAE